jgi:hypothetical protein
MACYWSARLAQGDVFVVYLFMHSYELCMYLCIFMYPCVYACMYACMYVCMYVCVGLDTDRQVIFIMYLSMYV